MSFWTRHKYRSLVAWLFMLCLVSCAEVIDLKNETSGGQLVIAGRITNGGMGNTVEITRTLPEEQAPHHLCSTFTSPV